MIYVCTVALLYAAYSTVQYDIIIVFTFFFFFFSPNSIFFIINL